MNSKKIRTIGAVLLAVLVLVYVGYQGYLATHRSIQTETAMYGQVSDVLQAQSFIIRNEQVIDESANGVLSYRVADGTREMMPMTVDFPAPLGPMRDNTLPLGIAKVTESTTVLPSYCFVSSFTCNR